ncbi:peroxisomal membrane protein PEX14-like [Halichondria panicea]|uniref:peroxisomal membrane protein PEX14-like n=1 Tax=Halichondria panicea TaxID=6063 RepID=UPI00312B35B1
MATNSETTGAEITPQDEDKTSHERSVLATNPPPPPVPQSRASLVDLAVKFLTNPRVTGSPMDQKRAFLTKKGLTEAEIDQAIQLAGVSNTASTITGPFAPPPLPARTLTPSSPTSWREYALIAAVVGGVGYAVYQFVRRFVLPWFEGRGKQEQKLTDIQSSVEQLETNIRDMVTSLNTSTNTLRDLLSEQQRHLQLLSTQVTGLQSSMAGQAGGDGAPLREIKEDVSTLKGLLLSRHQFPPTPSRSNGHGSGIPQWQRATPTKPNGLTSDGSSNGSSPETTSKGGLVNGAESGSETASKGGLVNGAESGSEPTDVKQEQEEETN